MRTKKPPTPAPLPTKSLAECEPCGYQWTPRTNNLGRCPRCGQKQGIHLLKAA